MPKLIKHETLPSQFDVVKENRFYETLEVVDILRLMQPYVKSDVSCEKQKGIVESFLEKFFEKATTQPFVISPYNLFSLQVIESKGEPIIKIVSKKGLDNRVRLLPQKDKDAMWAKEMNTDGYDWEVIGILNKKYDFYQVVASNELNAKVKMNGAKGGKFLTAPMQWQNH